MGELAKLPNIGRVVEEELEQTGITTRDQLVQTGAEQAWLNIQKNDPSACIHRLLALEGAVRGVKKADIPQERKEALKRFYQEHKL